MDSFSCFSSSVCTGEEGPDEALATGEPDVAEVVLPLSALPFVPWHMAAASIDPRLAGSMCALCVLMELVGEAQDEGVEQVVAGTTSSMRSMDFLRGFSGGTGAISCCCSCCCCSCSCCSNAERCMAAVTAADLAGGGGGAAVSLLIFVGERGTRSALNLTGLTFFGLAAGIGGSGGDFTGLPILPLRGLISGGIAVGGGVGVGVAVAAASGCCRNGALGGSPLDTLSASIINPVPGTVRMMSQRLRSLWVRGLLVLVKCDVHFFCFSMSSRELNFLSGFSGLSTAAAAAALAKSALTEPAVGGAAMTAAGTAVTVLTEQDSSVFRRDKLCCGYLETTTCCCTVIGGSTMNLLLLNRSPPFCGCTAVTPALLLFCCCTNDAPEGKGIRRFGGDCERSEERDEERSEPSQRLSSREPLRKRRELTFEFDSTPSFSKRARALLNLAEWDSVRTVVGG